jgi:trehalose-6-phosphatase
MLPDSIIGSSGWALFLDVIDPRTLDEARDRLGAFVKRHPGLVLEDKGHGVALHFRRVPHSIRVGTAHETVAQHRFPGVPHVLRWLQSVASPSSEQGGAVEDWSR